MTDPALLAPTHVVSAPYKATAIAQTYSLVDQARDTLRQTIDRYIPQLELTRSDTDELKRQAAVKTGIDQLTALLSKLDSTLLRVAVFGLVSRGKSAVLKALVGEKILETGPINGVTQWPRSIYWTPSLSPEQPPLKIELIDTPGLDEIEGAERSQVAQNVAQQADLILFVVAGDITRTEYAALQTLHETRNPLLLIFNNTDLYPDTDRQAVYTNLQRLQSQLSANPASAADPIHQTDLPLVDDVILVAADPSPLQVRIEWPDGHITEEWETPQPEITPLKTALIDLVQTEGPTLVDGSAGLTAYAGAMGAQAAAAGYGTYAVGHAARVYLERGCSWGPQGIKTLMQTIVENAKTESALERLQQEVKQSVEEQCETPKQ